MKDIQWLLLGVAIMFSVSIMMKIEACHFRGGTISWKSEGGRKVRFSFQLGWTYGNGPGCTQAKLGQLVTRKIKTGGNHWVCQFGCASKKNISDVSYYCTDVSQKDDWEQGKNDFTYTFPNKGSFRVQYMSSAWMQLSNGKGNSWWSLVTTGDLRQRSDTGNINSSPVTMSKPMYIVQFGCHTRLQIPIIDPDMDTVRCRWAKGLECLSVCKALPGAVLDEETCTLSFNATTFSGYINNGIYVGALTIEDFSKIPMTMGSTKKTPSDVISSIPLQFVVKTISQTGGCDANPRFVPPTPEIKEVITVEDEVKVMVDIFADSANDPSAKANKISVHGPITMTQSPVIPNENRKGTFQTTLTWQTEPQYIGDHIVCVYVENDKGKSGNQRCFTIKVVPKGCKSLPCRNNGQCFANMGSYKCICRPGYTGHDCEKNIDDCASNPCVNGTHCFDGINSYVCLHRETTTTTMKPTTTTTTPSTSTTTTATTSTTTTPTTSTTTTTTTTMKPTTTTAKPTTSTTLTPTTSTTTLPATTTTTTTTTTTPATTTTTISSTSTTTTTVPTTTTILASTTTMTPSTTTTTTPTTTTAITPTTIKKPTLSTTTIKKRPTTTILKHISTTKMTPTITSIMKPNTITTTKPTTTTAKAPTFPTTVTQMSTTTAKPTTNNTINPITTTLPKPTTIKTYNPSTISTTSKTFSKTTKSTTTTTAKPCMHEYEPCYCIFRPSHQNQDWVVQPRTCRDVLGVLFGFPTGLILSVFTFLISRYCKNLRVAGARTYPRPKMGLNLKKKSKLSKKRKSGAAE